MFNFQGDLGPWNNSKWESWKAVEAKMIPYFFKSTMYFYIHSFIHLVKSMS